MSSSALGEWICIGRRMTFFVRIVLFDARTTTLSTGICVFTSDSSLSSHGLRHGNHLYTIDENRLSLS